MKKIFLHIGTEKTGTTTIQSFFSSNRKILKDNGVIYPRSPGQANHTDLCIFAAQAAFNDLVPPGFAGDGAAYSVEVKKRLADSLVEEVSEPSISSVVFSNEHCSSRLHKRDEIVVLKDLLERISPDITIVIYLRRQDEAWMSLYSTLVKSGSTKTPEEALSMHLAWFNYEQMLDLWSSVFGKNRVVVRRFDRASFLGGTLESDFLHTIGCNNIEGMAPVPPQNTSLDSIKLEYLRMFNAYVPCIVKGRRNPLRGNVEALLSMGAAGDPLVVDAEILDRIYKKYSEGNSAVARRYFGSEDGVLFPSVPKKNSGAAHRTLTADEVIEISAELWMQKQQQVTQQLAKIRQLKKRLSEFLPDEDL